MSSHSVGLKFGIEMEFLLKPKSSMKEALQRHKFDDKVTSNSQDNNAKQANRDALRKALVDILEVDNAIGAGISPASYEKWTVADERALDEPAGFCKSTIGLQATRMGFLNLIKQLMVCWISRAMRARLQDLDNFYGLAAGNL
jgi:hypothetical protein